MKRERIGWRDVLARLAELPALGDAERRRIARVLSSPSAGDQEAVAREVLERLAEEGVLLRGEAAPSPTAGAAAPHTPATPAVRARVTYTTPDGYRRFTVPLAAGSLEPVQRLARPVGRDIRAFPPETVRTLLELQGQVVSQDHRVLAGPADAILHALLCARDVLAVDYVSFRLVRPGERPLEDIELTLPAPPLALPGEEEAVIEENDILHVPDLTRVPGGEASGYAAAAVVRVTAPGGSLVGALGVWSRHRGHFTRERLGTLDLLGEIAGDLVAKAESLAQVVFIDPLTQLHNRSYFHLQARKEIARAKRENTSMVLCILDLDEFKRLNDYPYGYEGANQVIRQVADILKGQVRPFDCVARWGGEEYTLLLAAPMTRDDAQAICERLRRAVETATFPLTGLDGREHEARVTVSAGAAVYPQDGTSTDELWRHANEALLVAKQPPKNAVVFWSADLGGANGPPRPAPSPRKPAPPLEPSPAQPTPPGSRPRAASRREGS